MISLLIFALPLDTLNVYSVITAFDFIFFFYLIYIFLSPKKLNYTFCIPRYTAISIGVIFFLIFLTLMSALSNQNFYLEHLKFASVLLWLCIKIIFVYNIVNSQKIENFVEIFFKGFVVLSAVFLISYVFGIGGYSGSGRYAAFYGNSNGLAAYAMLAFSVSLPFLCNSKLKKTSILSIFMAALLALLSVSRGAFIFLLLASFLFYIVTSKRKKFNLVLIFLFFSIAISSGAANEFALYLVESVSILFPEMPIERLLSIVNFMFNFQFDLQELDESRSEISKAVIQSFLTAPTIFGNGLESSVYLTEFEIRPHNILLSSLHELGILASLLFAFILVYMIIGSWMSYRTRDDVPSLFALMFSFSIIYVSMKTPFYFQKAIAWYAFTLVLFMTKHKNGKHIPSNN